MWFVLAFVAVAAVCGPGHKRVAVAVGCDWMPSVWSWQLDVIGTQSLEVPVVCAWCPRVWMWQLDVVGCPSVLTWQLYVIGTHEFGGASWMWLVPACVAMAAGCDWVTKCVVMAIGYDWYPRV